MANCRRIRPGIIVRNMPHATDGPPSAAEILARYDDQARANIAAEPTLGIERNGATVRMTGLWDTVIYSQLTEATADAAIELEKARPLVPGRRLEWKVYGHDQPSDLAARLERAGFEPDAPETLVAFDLSTELPQTDLPQGVVIRRVTDRAGLADVAAVGLRAFGEDFSHMNDEFRARIEYGTVLFYLAYCEGKPVSAARLELPRSGEFAGLFGGGTVPEHRSRGIYRALVGARDTEARARGYRYLTVDAQATSSPILQRMGFVPLTTVTSWYYQAEPRRADRD
jgi:GNAT superfamily N-acetyltransferase